MNIKQSIAERRRWFEDNLDCVGRDATPHKGVLFTCPCCGYPTLDERGGYDICCLCNWEDDGQDDPDADKMFGGPNKGYSLTQARDNFAQRLVMYSPGDDPRIGGEDSAIETDAKRAITTAFDAMGTATNEADRKLLWSTVADNQRILANETDRKIREYEARFKASD